MSGWNPSKPFANRLLVLLLLLPVALFYAVTSWKLVPVPVEDDYVSMLGFALKWNALHDLPHRVLLVLTNQHNEYKMPLTFGLQSIELAWTHHVHIGAWMWLGNCMALAMLVPLWTACLPGDSTRTRLTAFVPVVWLVMNLNYAEALNFALTGFQALSAITWSLGCILMLTRRDRLRNLAAIPMALLACGTNANALLLAPIGLLILGGRRRWRMALLWSGCLLVEAAVYFYRYHPIAHPKPSLGTAIAYFIAAAGCAFGFHAFYLPAIVAGTILLAVFAFLVRRGAAEVQPFGFWAAIWLLASFAMITYGRAGTDFVTILVSRYKVNCDLFMALLYLQALSLRRAGRLPELRLRLAVPALAAFLLLFVAYSDALGWYRLERRALDVRYGMNAYLQSGGAVSPMTYRPSAWEAWMLRPGVMEKARVILNQARAQDLYRIPDRF